MTRLVNTALAGSYTTSKSDVVVTGVLNPGTYNDLPVSLTEYFDGSLVDSNIGPSAPISQNWVDDGGEAPLKQDMPADHVQSNQASLVTHLYEFFGSVLGCSSQGTGVFGSYAGHASMFSVHQ